MYVNAGIYYKPLHDDKLFFNKLSRKKNRHCRLLYDFMVVCECAVYVGAVMFTLVLTSEKTTTATPFCLLISFAFVLYVRRMNAASMAAIAPAREEKRVVEISHTSTYISANSNKNGYVTPLQSKP